MNYVAALWNIDKSKGHHLNLKDWFIVLFFLHLCDRLIMQMGSAP